MTVVFFNDRYESALLDSWGIPRRGLKVETEQWVFKPSHYYITPDIDLPNHKVILKLYERYVNPVKYEAVLYIPIRNSSIPCVHRLECAIDVREFDNWSRTLSLYFQENAN